MTMFITSLGPNPRWTSWTLTSQPVFMSAARQVRWHDVRPKSGTSGGSKRRLGALPAESRDHSQMEQQYEYLRQLMEGPEAPDRSRTAVRQDMAQASAQKNRLLRISMPRSGPEPPMRKSVKSDRPFSSVFPGGFPMSRGRDVTRRLCNCRPMAARQDAVWRPSSSRPAETRRPITLNFVNLQSRNGRPERGACFVHDDLDLDASTLTPGQTGTRFCLECQKEMERMTFSAQQIRLYPRLVATPRSLVASRRLCPCPPPPATPVPSLLARPRQEGMPPGLARRLEEVVTDHQIRQRLSSRRRTSLVSSASSADPEYLVIDSETDVAEEEEFEEVDAEIWD